MCNHSYAEGSRVTCGVANCMRITGQLKDVTSQPVNKLNIKQNVYCNTWNLLKQHQTHVSFYHTIRMFLQKFMSFTAPAHHSTQFVINNIRFYFFSNTSQPLMVNTRKVTMKFIGVTNSNCTPYIHSLVTRVVTCTSHHHQ